MGRLGDLLGRFVVRLREAPTVTLKPPCRCGSADFRDWDCGCAFGCDMCGFNVKCASCGEIGKRSWRALRAAQEKEP